MPFPLKLRNHAPHGGAVIVAELQARHQLLEVGIVGHAEFLDHLTAERRHGERHFENVLFPLLCRDDDFFDEGVSFTGCLVCRKAGRCNECRSERRTNAFDLSE